MKTPRLCQALAISAIVCQTLANAHAATPARTWELPLPAAEDVFAEPADIEWSQGESLVLSYTDAPAEDRLLRWEVADKSNLWISAEATAAGGGWRWALAPTQTCLPAGRYAGRIAVYAGTGTNYAFHRVAALQSIRVHGAFPDAIGTIPPPIPGIAAAVAALEAKSAALEEKVAALWAKVFPLLVPLLPHGSGGFAASDAGLEAPTHVWAEYTGSDATATASVAFPDGRIWEMAFAGGGDCPAHAWRLSAETVPHPPVITHGGTIYEMAGVYADGDITQPTHVWRPQE